MLRNNFSNYISRNMNYRNELVCDVKEYKDPMTDYEENSMPKYLPTGETSAVKKSILDQQVKLYVKKEAEIKDNICDMYDKIWGLCNDDLKIMIEHEKVYEEK